MLSLGNYLTLHYIGPIKVHFLLQMGMVRLTLSGPIKVHFLLQIGVVSMSLSRPMKVHFLFLLQMGQVQVLVISCAKKKVIIWYGCNSNTERNDFNNTIKVFFTYRRQFHNVSSTYFFLRKGEGVTAETCNNWQDLGRNPQESWELPPVNFSGVVK